MTLPVSIQRKAKCKDCFKYGFCMLHDRVALSFCLGPFVDSADHQDKFQKFCSEGKYRKWKSVSRVARTQAICSN